MKPFDYEKYLKNNRLLREFDNRSSIDQLNDLIADKDPVEVFERLYNTFLDIDQQNEVDDMQYEGAFEEEIISHIIMNMLSDYDVKRAIEMFSRR